MKYIFKNFYFSIIPTLVPNPEPGNIGQSYGFGYITNLGQGLNQLIPPIFSIAVFLVIIYALVGAFKYLTAGGDKEAVEGAQQMITHAIIGFFLLMFIFLILEFLPQAFNFKLPGLL